MIGGLVKWASGLLSSAHGGNVMDRFDAAISSAGQSIAGERVTPTSANALSAYFACIRNISEDMAKLPLPVFRRLPNGDTERVSDHQVSLLLNVAPNPTETSMSFREGRTQNALAWGDGYAEIRRDMAGNPLSLHALHPQFTKPKERSDGELEFVIRKPNGEDRTIPGEDVLHVKGFGEGIQGIAIADIGKESLGTGLALQAFGASFFGNGTTIGGVLQHPETLSDPAAKRLKESWNEKHQGPRNAHKVAILEEGMTWQGISMPMRHAQFLESRQFQIEEVARWFRMPPHKIQHLLRSTFSNIEQQSIEYVVDTLMPWFKRWEAEINLKLLPSSGEFFVEHQAQALLRGDSAARAKFYKDLFQMAAISPNDIRRFENMNGIGPEGDRYFIPLNISPIAATPPPPPPQRQLPGRTGADIVRACLPAIHDAAKRMAQKESKALARAAGKEGGERAEALNRFYSQHVVHIVESLTPPVTTLAILNGTKANYTFIVKSVASAHCDKSRIHALTDGLDLFKYSDKIKSDLAASMASDIVDKLKAKEKTNAVS